MIIKGAIFDLDGTLLDSMGVWDNIGYKYLRSKSKIGSLNLNEILKPMSLLQAAQYFKKNYNISDSESKIIEDINTLVVKEYNDSILLKPGVKQILEILKSKNIKMCIATAAQYELAKSALIRLDIEKYFYGIITCGEVGYGKDNPSIYYKALEILGTNIEDTIVFEDALHAIKTAKKAGFRVAAIYDKSSEDDMDEIKYIADWYLI